ncbi:hypothetical protein [Flavobacterium psychrophilum]|uniref:hypothetical protein n=1 Tax=Flavobacterium psychrophilum TaxID=96345 RepID=UPI0006187789|nr:hypothetical protein [Flavobacterium psychrophilum]OAE90497.1 hypothetical protein SU65_12225 [Flavobacterium psychrophilum]
MKNVFLFALILVCSSVFAQEKKDGTELYYYGARYYNISPCGCYTFPEKDSIYNKKDTIKPAKTVTFVRRKSIKNSLKA